MQAQSGDQADATGSAYLGTFATDFAVGNPMGTQQTVNLVVHPLQLPLDWSYSLSQVSLLLGPGESTTVTLTVDVGHSVPEDSQARIAVEGYIGANLIGGVLFEQEIPAAAPTLIYLPLVMRSQG